VAPTPAPRAPGAPIPLLPVDLRLLDAAPVLALVRLDRTVPSEDVRRAFLRSVPRRISAVLDGSGDELVLRHEPGRVGFAAVDVAPDELQALTGVDVPFSALTRIGLGDAPALDPLCTLVHVRVPDGDALAVRMSHAAGDGMSLLGLLGRVTAELAGAPDDDDRPAPGGGPPADLGAAGVAGRGGRRLSVLPLSDACRTELQTVAAERPDLSATVRRMAVLARRIAPLGRPADEGLRVRIPVDLRFRDLGIPADAVGNHWFDALADFDGPLARLPSAASMAATIAAEIRACAADLAPEDVEHREDRSLWLRRPVPAEPLRRGVDLVHSSLPVPPWPGLRELLVTGLSPFGVVDVRGSDRVAVVTPGPLPAGVREL